MIIRISTSSRTLVPKRRTNHILLALSRSISSTARLDRPLLGSRSCPIRSSNDYVRTSTNSFSRAIFRRSIFGFSFPTASNEPLAGTIDGSGPPFLFILQVFIGLPVVLWAYKCLVLVIFQRKIIYLPSVPPGTRNESLNPPESLRASQLNGLDWKEIEVESSAKTRWSRTSVNLKGLELSLASNSNKVQSDVVIIYLQGNAGTPLMRVPLFYKILQLRSNSSPNRIKIITIAPRSFWLSTRSAPSQSTILADYTSFLQHTISSNPTSKFILYGHSLGGSAALHLLSQNPHLAKHIQGVILENPLPSIPYMVKALYPQKWLPYHYLGPLSFDKWDSISILRNSPALFKNKKILWLRSERDEIVPNEEDEGVKEMWNLSSGDKKWVVIDRALHDTAFLESKWKEEVGKFIDEVINSKD